MNPWTILRVGLGVILLAATAAFLLGGLFMAWFWCHGLGDAPPAYRLEPLVRFLQDAWMVVVVALPFGTMGILLVQPRKSPAPWRGSSRPYRDR